MLILQIGFKLNLEMVLNVIQLQFLQMCLSPDALAAHLDLKVYSVSLTAWHTTTASTPESQKFIRATVQNSCCH